MISRANQPRNTAFLRWSALSYNSFVTSQLAVILHHDNEQCKRVTPPHESSIQMLLLLKLYYMISHPSLFAYYILAVCTGQSTMPPFPREIWMNNRMLDDAGYYVSK